MRYCSDCHNDKVAYVCHELSCYLCAECKAIHDSFPGQIDGSPRYRCITESLTSEELLDPLDHDYHKDTYESKFPPFYRRPYSNCPEFYRSQFIKAKYIWRVFNGASNAITQLTSYTKQGILLKRLRDTNKFVSRHFRLEVIQNSLKYFIKPDDSTPKACIDLEKLNATFIDCEAYRLPSYTLLINYIKNGSTRNIFVRSEDPKVIIDWYNVIRFGKFHRILLSSSGMNETIDTTLVSAQLVQDVRIFGWLEKTGPSATDAWRKRWVYAIGRKLLYSSDPTAPYPKGEIFLGHSADGYDVKLEAPPNWKKHSGFAFTIYCPTSSSLSSSSPTTTTSLSINSNNNKQQQSDKTTTATKSASTSLSSTTSIVNVDANHARKYSNPELGSYSYRPYVFMTQYREVRDRWCEYISHIIATPVTLADRKEAATRDTARIRSMRL